LNHEQGAAVVRVIGSDPGTSSLDLLLLEDGVVVDQARWLPAELRDSPEALVRRLRDWAPVDLVAAPSGYGLPLVRGEDLTEDQLDQMSLVRPDQRGKLDGLIGFRACVRAFVRSGLPIVFLPGGRHLATIPLHRKANAVDLGTADKIAVAALALWFDAEECGGCDRSTFALAEIGSAFSALLVVDRGRLVDASAGTRGPIGLRSRGFWDGEIAYWNGPLSKDDLFRGGLADLGAIGLDAFRECLAKHAAGLRAVTPFTRIYLSGRGLEQPEIAQAASDALGPLARLAPLANLAGAWVKHAAQGSAVLADALAGGRFAGLAAALELRSASGSVWEVLAPPRC
jgi:predicted butyrate kinase (DUF1464 family)